MSRMGIFKCNYNCLIEWTSLYIIWSHSSTQLSSAVAGHWEPKFAWQVYHEAFLPG